MNRNIVFLNSTKVNFPESFVVHKDIFCYGGETWLLPDRVIWVALRGPAERLINMKQHAALLTLAVHSTM